MPEKFAKDLVKVNELKELEVDGDCKTSVAGIFAAGDVTNAPAKQIIVAAHIPKPRWCAKDKKE